MKAGIVLSSEVIPKYRKDLDKYLINKIGLLPYIVQQMKGEEFQWSVYRMRAFSERMNPELISEYAHPPL